MTSENGSTATSSMSRGWRIVLIASLALNVLIIGAVGSALLFSRHGGFGWRHGHKFGLMGFAPNLPADRRDVIVKAIKASRERTKPMRTAEREARKDAREALIADPFSEEKLQAALQRVADAEYEMRKARLETFSEVVGELTPEERQELYEWKMRHRRWHHRKRPPKDPPPSL